MDTAARSFVASPSGTLPAPPNAFFQEDVESVELYFLKPTGDFSSPYTYLNYGANTVKLAVGLTAPAALQTSWTSVSTAITTSITTLTNGGSGANEVQRITFSGRTPAEGSFALTLPSRSFSFSGATISAGFLNLPFSHGLVNGQQIFIPSIEFAAAGVLSDRYWYVRNRTDNAFQISATPTGAISSDILEADEAVVSAISTPLISASASASEVQQVFVDAGISVNGLPQILVTGSYAAGFTFTFANALANVNFPAMTVSSTLAAAPALQANVSFNTNEVAALIAAGNTQNLKLEVEVSSGAVRQTYSTPASISDDIITSASTSPLPTGTANSFSLSDGAGGVWTVTVDASGILTTAKQ